MQRAFPVGQFRKFIFKKFGVQQIENFVQIPGHAVIACQFFHVFFSPILDFGERASYNGLALSVAVWVKLFVLCFGRRVGQGAFL